jgi:hypothetical protein
MTGDPTGGWWWPAPEANGPAFWCWGCCYRCLEILVGHLIRRWRRYGRSIVSEHDLDWWWLMMIYGRFSIQSRSVAKIWRIFFSFHLNFPWSFHHFSMLSGDPKVLISIYLIPSNLFMTCVFPTPMRARGCGLCDSDNLRISGGGNGSARNPYSCGKKNDIYLSIYKYIYINK